MPQAPRVTVTDLREDGLEVFCELPGLEIVAEESMQGRFAWVGWPQASIAGEVGRPAVPVARKLVLLPRDARVELDIAEGSHLLLDLRGVSSCEALMPVQAPIPLLPGAREQALFRYDKSAYATNQFVPEERVVLREAGIVRGRRVAVLEIRPVAYNPAQGLLQVWPLILVRITFAGGRTADDAASGPMARLEGVVLNPQPNGKLGRQAGNYLMVLPSAFDGIAPITDFIAAKTAQGFNVMTYVVPPGTTKETIKAYIESLWGTPDAPDFVLLASDTNTLPHWWGGGSKAAGTDLPYACMDGPDDWYPDIAIGRFAVRTESDLASVVDKTLYIENGLFADPTFLRNAVFMAGMDSLSGDEETHDWVVSTYMDPNDMISNKLYVRTYGATTEDVHDAFSAGCLYGAFFGHSYGNCWQNGPFFDHPDVQGLDDGGLCVLLLHMTCSMGKYWWDATCFADVWQRAPNKGAVVGIAASTYIAADHHPWSETMDLERFVFDTIYLDEVLEVGPAWQGALMRLLAAWGPDHPPVRNYFEMFNILGDPSLLLPLPRGFTLVPDPTEQSVCTSVFDQAQYTIDVDPLAGFSDTVTLAATGQPAGTTVDFSVDSGPPPFTSIMTVGNLTGATPGDYEIQVTGTSTEYEIPIVLGLTLRDDSPGMVTLESPPDGATGVPPLPDLSWQAAFQAGEYEIEIATDVDFANIVYSATEPETTHSVGIALDPSILYYWHVRALNCCGDGAFSDTFTFTGMEVLNPVAYDMLNGEDGAYTYFDDLYDGEGDNDQPLAPLSGGLGDLTDGELAAGHWNSTPGPYVGWYTIDPTITFHFTDPVNVKFLSLHFDDHNGTAGVQPPSQISITMGETTVDMPVEDPPEGVPFMATFSGLDLTGDTLELTLLGGSGVWVLLSEAQFHGSTGVGACCIDESCSLMTPEQCATSLGAYQGDGTTCDPNPCAPMVPGCLILSEVVKGVLSGGCPRFVEITNTGLNDYTFSEGGLIVQMDEDTDVFVDVDLTGYTIHAGQSFVINSNESGSCTGAFASIYGFSADLDVQTRFGDGNDRYILTDTADGSNLLDIYGEFGESSGEWEYYDGYSYRLSAYNHGNGGVFVADEWFFGGNGSLDTPTPEKDLLILTDPQTHTYDEDCLPAGDIDGSGSVSLEDYALFAVCLAGPGVSTPPVDCLPEQFARSDMDEDNDVDVGDFCDFAEVLPTQ